MSEENKNYILKDNQERKQFELVIEGHTARIEYMIMASKIFLTHTEVPSELEGRGIGSIIVELALEEVEKRGLKLIPLCPFVGKYLTRHPEWKRILADDVRLK
ncbi:MAG TPA: GNAT family N-acetyltransferase [Ignavibacteria bacterium]|nr:GNAT family N-acetyltransferase [Ignavibacteria bacterium]HMQ98654.1 GNAT family N-acetyltransferase [Ignavibacteria bacterium]